MVKSGWSVIPLRERDKRPIWDEWPKKGVATSEGVDQLAAKYPLHNYGMFRDDVAILDIDLDKDSNATLDSELEKLQHLLGRFEPRFMQKTGSGGYHIPFYTHGREIHSQSLTEVSEIKGWHSQIVGAGSIHPETGRCYEIYNGEEPSDITELSEVALDNLARSKVEYEPLRVVLPEGDSQQAALFQGSRREIGADGDKTLRGLNTTQSSTAQSALDYAKPVLFGSRNDTLFRIGCHYREVNRLQRNDIYAILKQINSNDCEIPLNDSELRAIAESCCTYPAGTPRPAVEPLLNEECSEEVQSLFQDNNLIELFRRNVQKFHVGDEAVTELLMLSVASMSVINTKGLQPKLSGESGMGKTHSTKTVLHLMHSTIYRAASFSSKALFYDDKLQPKMVIFSDDVNLAPEVEETVRAAMTNWNSPTEHITLDAKRNPITLSLPPRVAFWLTSISTKSTIQLLNRQVEMNVDESPSQDKRVEQHQRRFAELGLPDFYDDNEVELIRQAFLHLNRVDFAVKIPFIDNIAFTDVRNRRNFSIFLDFVKAYCVLNYRARQTDEDGALIATKQDFDNALELFKTVAVQQVTKLNDREREVAAVIKENSPCDVPTIMDKTGLSRSRVSELVHGDKDSGNRGMLEKIPELKFYSRREAKPDGYPWGRNHYALPEAWSIVSSYESIVYWEDADKNADQLRDVSDCFGDNFRNSKGREEGLDSRLVGVNGHLVHSTSTTFGSSEEYETTLPGSSTPAPDRSYETEQNGKWNRPTAPSQPEADARNDLRCISETRSEVERNSSEIDNTRSSKDGDSQHIAATDQALGHRQTEQTVTASLDTSSGDKKSESVRGSLHPSLAKRSQQTLITDDDFLFKFRAMVGAFKVAGTQELKPQTRKTLPDLICKELADERAIHLDDVRARWDAVCNDTEIQRDLDEIFKGVAKGEIRDDGNNKRAGESANAPEVLDAALDCLSTLILERLRLRVGNNIRSPTVDELMVQTVKDVHTDHPDVDLAEIAAAFRVVQLSYEGQQLIKEIVQQADASVGGVHAGAE
jgi:hypothetical protein